MTPKFRNVERKLGENRSNRMISGVILAGKRMVHNQLLEFVSDVNNKALIEIDGKVMIQHVINSMNELRYIANIGMFQKIVYN